MKALQYNISFPSKTFLIGEYAVLEGAPAILVNTKPRFHFFVTENFVTENFVTEKLVTEKLVTEKSGDREINNPASNIVLTKKTLSSQERDILSAKKARSFTSVSSVSVKNGNPGKNKEWFHLQSPAGQWLKHYPEISQFYHIESQDPYFGKGGFGFSSAQFDVVYLLSRFLNLRCKKEQSALKDFAVLNSLLNQTECKVVQSSKGFFLTEDKDSRGAEKEVSLRKDALWKDEELFQLWNAYRKLNFKGQKPSGADVISQWLGGVCLFSFAPFSARSIAWPFADLDFFLIRTNTKLNTHTHLDILSERNFSDLSSLAEKAKACMNERDKEGFISALEEYSICLKKRGLVHEGTLLFLEHIRSLKPVIVAKGCGAMGAEVIAVFFDPKDKETLKNLLKKENIVASADELTDGIQICQK